MLYSKCGGFWQAPSTRQGMQMKISLHIDLAQNPGQAKSCQKKLIEETAASEHAWCITDQSAVCLKIVGLRGHRVLHSYTEAAQSCSALSAMELIIWRTWSVQPVHVTLSGAELGDAEVFLSAPRRGGVRGSLGFLRRAGLEEGRVGAACQLD